jgi:hypothetical protein
MHTKKKNEHPLLTDAQSRARNGFNKKDYFDPLNGIYNFLDVLSENLPTKRVKVWTNYGSICTLGTLIQKNLWVKSVMTPIILEKIESTRI